MDVMEKLVELPIDDAILILKEEHKQRADGYTTHLAHGGKGDPAEEVNLDALATAISALEQTKWISVKDRLPSDNGKYLCHIFDSSLNNLSFIAMVYYDRGNFIGQSTCVTDCVTHWMPLPEPPKGE